MHLYLYMYNCIYTYVCLLCDDVWCDVCLCLWWENDMQTISQLDVRHLKTSYDTCWLTFPVDSDLIFASLSNQQTLEERAASKHQDAFPLLLPPLPTFGENAPVPQHSSDVAPPEMPATWTRRSRNGSWQLSWPSTQSLLLSSHDLNVKTLLWWL